MPKLPPAAKPDPKAKTSAGLRPDGDVMVGTAVFDGWTFTVRFRQGRIDVLVEHPAGTDAEIGSMWAVPRGES